MLMIRLPIETKLGFMKLRYIAFALSAVALAASIVLIPIKGLNLGIDFAGGMLVEVTKPPGADISDIRDLANELELKVPNVSEAMGTGANPTEAFLIKAALPDPVEPAESEEAATDAAAGTEVVSITQGDEAQRFIDALEED